MSWLSPSGRLSDYSARNACTGMGPSEQGQATMLDEVTSMEQYESGSELYAMEVPEILASELGRDVLRIGDVELAKRTWERQGSEFGATSGLAAAANCLRMLGIDIHEQGAVELAAQRGLCNIGASTHSAGGTTAHDQLTILKAFSVPVQLKVMESLDQLVECVRDGQVVLTHVNAGALWHDENAASAAYYQNGEANHVVQVVGLANDRETNELLGFYVNDSAAPDGAASFVSAEAMHAAAIGSPDYPAYGNIITTQLGRRIEDT